MDRAEASTERGAGAGGSKDIFNSINEEMAKENLIRSPEMIRSVREELKKYAAIAAKVTEFELLISDNQNEEKWLDQFIEALYTGTITKKGRSSFMIAIRKRTLGSRLPIC